MAYKNNVLLGAGHLFMRRAGEKVERYVGDTLSATLSSETERLTVDAGDGVDTSSKLIDRVVSTTHTLRLVLRSIDLDNVALFLAGSASDQSVTAVADEILDIGAGPGAQAAADALKADVAAAASLADVAKLLNTANTGAGTAVHRLGAAPGVAAVEAAGFTIKSGTGGSETSESSTVDLDAAAPPTLVQVRAAKVLLSSARALVAVLDKALVATNMGIKASYTPVAAKRVTTGGADSVKSVAIRYREDADIQDDSDEGDSVSLGRHLYIESATVSPDGEWSLKSRESVQQLPLSCVADGAVYVDGAEA